MKLYIHYRHSTWQLLVMLLTLFFITSCVVVVNEWERVVITRLGKPVREYVEAGAHFKAPWPFESVNVQEKRMFIYQAEPKAIPTADKRMLVVDLFALVHIIDGTRFLQKVGTLETAGSRIDTVLFSELRDVVGKHSLKEVIGEKRDEFMDKIAQNTGERLKEFGLSVDLVRANRTDLPTENKASIYGNMIAERNSEATRIRAEGTSEATRLHAEGDRQYQVILSEAAATGLRMRGEGDASATKLFNETYGKDPEFFEFYRGIESAQSILGSSEARLILTGDEPHLRALLK